MGKSLIGLGLKTTHLDSKLRTRNRANGLTGSGLDSSWGLGLGTTALLTHLTVPFYLSSAVTVAGLLELSHPEPAIVAGQPLAIDTHRHRRRCLFSRPVHSRGNRGFWASGFGTSTRPPPSPGRCHRPPPPAAAGLTFFPSLDWVWMGFGC